MRLKASKGRTTQAGKHPKRMRGVRLGALTASLGAALALAPLAHAGFDHPLQHAPLSKHAERAIIPGERCPKAGNPVECSGNQAAASPDASLPSPPERNPANRPECRRLHWLYLFRHPLSAPADLQFVHGCTRWEMDYEYHMNGIHVDRSLWALRR